MLSVWTKSLGLRPLTILSLQNKYLFSGYRTQTEHQGEFNYKQKKDYLANRKLFKTQSSLNKTDIKNLNKRNQADNNVEELVKTINEINKQFLGIKLNTDYFKVYNQRSFEDVCKPDKTQFYKINDLPFAVKSKNSSNEKQSTQTQTQSLPNNTAVKMLHSMISQQRLTKQLERLAKTYFSDLLSRERKSRLEANFEVYSRKVIETLKANKWNFKLSNPQATPKVTLKNVTILKGIKVNRNDNYTIDSYQTNLDEADQGITTYTLWKKQREQYPEAEWFAQKFIVARIEADVQNCPVVEINEQNNMQSSTKGVTHSFVFEADLTVPPSLSLLTLTPEQHLKSYRLKPENIHITNVDNKNVWFNIAFKEDEKKSRLVNKII